MEWNLAGSCDFFFLKIAILEYLVTKWCILELTWHTGRINIPRDIPFQNNMVVIKGKENL
jgi:hypothetical protein